jgi:hypothetical protein
LLMRQDLAGPARGHCELAVLCGASVFLASSLTMPACAQSLRRALYAAAGAVSTALLVVLGTILRGTSPGALIDGVLRAPLRASGLFSIFGGISPRTIPSALLVSACIGALYLFRARGWISPDWVNALRCVVGLWAIAMLTVGSPGLYWVLPFLPLGLMPVQRGAWQSSDHIPRGFVTCLAATQFLQTYPVAGSQLAIAAAPVLLWAFICVHDGAGGLFGLARRATEAFGDRISQESALGGLVAIALVMAMLHSRDWLRGYPYPPSHLRGSASLHIRTELEDRYLFLAGSIGANCDFLFTLPGMGSLNFWSGVPTPNGSNTTAWMRTFSPGRQQRILDTLQASPRGCVVYSPSLASFWGPAVEKLDGIPLARYIIRDMPIAAEKDGYEIRVHPHRDSPWLTPASQPSP